MTTNLNDDFIKKAFLQDIKALSEKAKSMSDLLPLLSTLLNFKIHRQELILTVFIFIFLLAAKGVTAYLEPTRRPTLRPNERFLRNTIASVEQCEFTNCSPL